MGHADDKAGAVTAIERGEQFVQGGCIEVHEIAHLSWLRHSGACNVADGWSAHALQAQTTSSAGGHQQVVAIALQRQTGKGVFGLRGGAQRSAHGVVRARAIEDRSCSTSSKVLSPTRFTTSVNKASLLLQHDHPSTGADLTSRMLSIISVILSTHSSPDPAICTA
jgi:hypothetical protein